jgi:GTP-binding protein HflX
VRKIVFGEMPFLLSDTVGFIRKLPHHLIESFKSTLDEVKESDILLHVVDLAHPQYVDHMNTVTQTLQDLEIQNKPTLIIFNKIDLYREKNFDALLDKETKNSILDELKQNMKNTFEHDNIFISATTKENLEELREKIKTMVETEYYQRFPYQVKRW